MTIVLTGSKNLLDIALNNLSLGRAHLGLGELAQAAEYLDRAVDGLRRAGQEVLLPAGLLARAAFHRHCCAFATAAADLTEALEIAERGPMRLHERDAHLEWARLCRDQKDAEAMRAHVARAREIVEATGYLRRVGEVEALEKRLTPGPSPALPPWPPGEGRVQPR